MPQARKVVHRSTKRVVGEIPLPAKNPEMIAWESFLERDAIWLLGFLRYVIYIASQPLKFEYLDANGEVAVHFPDFQVDVGTQRYLIEIKPEKFVKDFQERTDRIRPQAQIRGYEYVVLDDSVIRIEPRLSNIKLLMRYRAMRPTDATLRLIDLAFERKALWTVDELITEYDEIDLLLIYTLLVNHVLQTNLHIPIGESSILKRCINFEEVVSHGEIFS
jgi:hypothetical protein